MSERTHREGISSNPKDRIGATKVPLSLIPLSAQIHTALAHFDGSLKYGVVNWRSESVAGTIYVDAALRHILKWFDREEKDADSGIHHLGHAVACLNIIMDAQHVGNLIDDRPPTADASAMLDQFREEVVRLIKLRGKDVPNTPPICDKEKSLFDYIPLLPKGVDTQPDPEPNTVATLDGRVTRTEAILGHQVGFINDNCGYIDGKYLQGTEFRSTVKLYRDGFKDIDEAMDYQYAQKEHKQKDDAKAYDKTWS